MAPTVGGGDEMQPTVGGGDKMAPTVAGSGVVVIANPVAGTTSVDLLSEVVARCAARCGEVVVERTRHRGHATALAARLDPAEVGTVVVVGGDGTVSEVVAGLRRLGARAPALAVVPAGTGNSTHREVWGDLDRLATLEASLDERRSRVRLLDLARLAGTGTCALLGVATGLVADALVTARDLHQVSGRDRYRLAIAQTLSWFKPYPGRVRVDGVEIHSGLTVLVNIGGGRYRGGRFKLLPHSVLDDGLLDVCVVDGALDPRELPGLTADGAHLRRPEVVYARGRRITVERTDGAPLSHEHDGEYVWDSTATACTVEVLPNVVPVRAPR